MQIKVSDLQFYIFFIDKSMFSCEFVDIQWVN